jgi:REP element-mobilizing transposase RayT
MEVTVRTIQSRLLLRPSHALNERVVGVLGRAQRLYGVRCCAVAFASNHFHALLQVDDAEQLARFMQHVDGNIAREVGDLVGWSGTFWARRYSAIPVSDEEAAQVERLRYILAHGVKENLVERVLDWPGVHAARSILDGKPLKGVTDRPKFPPWDHLKIPLSS